MVICDASNFNSIIYYDLGKTHTDHVHIIKRDLYRVQTRASVSARVCESLQVKCNEKGICLVMEN